ncbi:hypothetical protein MEZE111188_17940 [Mesobacillus zeae]
MAILTLVVLVEFLYGNGLILPCSILSKNLLYGFSQSVSITILLPFSDLILGCLGCLKIFQNC